MGCCMYISEVNFRNYRNFYSAKFKFTKGINTIIGENASGKTNLFKALEMILSSSIGSNNFFLEEKDFSRELKDWRGHWIFISIQFEKPNPVSKISLGESKGVLNYIFRPNQEIRENLFENNENKIICKEILSKIEISDYEVIIGGKSTKPLESDAGYKEIVGDFDRYKFGSIELQNSVTVTGETIPKYYELKNNINFTFIMALRDVVKDLKQSNSNLLLKLIKNANSAEDTKCQISKILKKIEGTPSKIERLDFITKLNQKINKKMNATVGKIYSQNYAVSSKFLTDVEKVLNSLTLSNLDNDELENLSLGDSNILYITLKLVEAELKKENRSYEKFNLMLLEEPEAHIHNHIKRNIFRNLDDNIQIFVSTHCTEISSSSKISQMNVLVKEAKKTLVCSPSNRLEPNTIIKIERYLDSIRTNILFAKKVLLVEGDAEAFVIPELVRNMTGKTLDEYGVSLVKMNGIYFKEIANLFHNERIRKKCVILTDLDTAIPIEKTVEEAIGLEEKGSAREKRLQHFLSAQKNGIDRRKKLDKFFSGSKYVKIFYANYTFEIDFFKEAPNKNILIKMLDDNQIYKSNSQIISSKTIINSDFEGEEVFKILGTVGKGWFALMLAEIISNSKKETVGIPKYIRDAFDELGIQK